MMSSRGVSVLESWLLEQGGEGTVGPRGRRGKWSSALLQPLSFLEIATDASGQPPGGCWRWLGQKYIEENE